MPRPLRCSSFAKARTGSMSAERLAGRRLELARLAEAPQIRRDDGFCGGLGNAEIAQAERAFAHHIVGFEHSYLIKRQHRVGQKPQEGTLETHDAEGDGDEKALA